jgi:hypothetical protein
MADSDSRQRGQGPILGRRAFFGLTGLCVLGFCQLTVKALGRASEPPPSLMSAPLELAGIWNGSPTNAVLRVVTRMREVSLTRVRLVSDRQPARIRIDEHQSGPPAVWLHSDHPDTAWIIVDVGPRDWCKLSYQFGHELGHVLCNSWQVDSKPRPPSQWIEESMVEAFSIRGLGLLADSWERNPPFAGDSAFSGSIRQYRQNLITNYAGAGGAKSDREIASWYMSNLPALERSALSGIEGPFIIRIVGELENDIACVEDLGALNRWPERSGLALHDYLSLWQKSCAEVHSPARLPARIRTLLAIS